MTPIRRRTAMIILAAGLIFCTSVWGEMHLDKSTGLVGDSAPLAVVGGKPITKEIFMAEMSSRRVEFNREREEELLDSLVRSELLCAAARSAGYENDPDVIAGVRQLLAGKYLRDNLEPKLARLKATDQEIQEYYRAHPSEFGVPDMVRAALIRIDVPAKASPEKKAELLKRAASVRAEALALEAGVPAFGNVAVKYSEDRGSRHRGGDIGWLRSGTNDGRWDKGVIDAIFALKAPGQVSPVISATDGLFVVKLIETRSASVRPFAEVRDGVRYLVVQEKRKKAEQEFIEQLKGRIAVTLNREALGAIRPDIEEKKPGPPALPVR